MDLNYLHNLLQLQRRDIVERTLPERVEVSGRRTTILILSTAFVLTAVILFVVLPRAAPALSSDYIRYSLGFADGYAAIADNLVSGRGYRIEPYASLTM